MRLYGRLGNQLFQFAACLSRQRHDGPTAVDTSWLGRGPGGRRELDACLLPGSISELHQLDLLRLRQLPRLWGSTSRAERLREMILRNPGVRDRYVFREESGTAFDERILDVDPPVLLAGYFQDERYFAGCEEIVRSKFRPASAATQSWLNACLRRADGMPLVAIGFREASDYTSLGWTLPDAYYERALESLQRSPSDYAYAVFGDEPDHNMLRAHRLLGETAVLMSAHELAPIEQLNAMAAFDTLIIPNSSFSWWGAWLSDFDHEHRANIIAPEPWVYFGMELVPDRWLKIQRPGGVGRSPEGL